MQFAASGETAHKGRHLVAACEQVGGNALDGRFAECALEIGDLVVVGEQAGRDGFQACSREEHAERVDLGVVGEQASRDRFERLGVGEQRVEGRHLLVVGEEFFGNRLQFAVREDDRTVGQLRVAREEILVDLGDRRAGEERTYRGDLRAVVKQVGGHFGDHVAVLEAVGEGFRLGCMVEQPVGNGFEDAAVGECIVEGGDLGEGFGVVGGNPFQLAAVLECARHRGQPRAAPVVNLPELFAQSVVGDVVGVERRHAALDRDDVVARVGVGVRGVGGGDVLLDAAVAPVDGGVDGLVERQIGLQARRGDVDSEDEGELFIGCAGGIDSVAEFTYREVDVPAGYFCCKVQVKGLKGGHSGGDIHLGRGNANKLLNRFLSQASQKYDMYLCEIDGGNLRNAIAREAHAVIAIPDADKHALRTDLNVFAAEVEAEYAVVDPDLQFVLESEAARPKAIDKDTAKRLLQTIYAAPHGVYAMSQDIPGLVETSTNLASVKMKPGHIIRIETSQRSSTASSKQDIANMVRTVFEMGGAAVSFGDGYPGWKPNPHSEILEVAVESYKRLFGVDAKVKAIHAGLECGLFLDKYPALDMISFGPTLQGVHSPDERMLIPTVQKFWDHLLDILKHIPVK